MPRKSSSYQSDDPFTMDLSTPIPNSANGSEDFGFSDFPFMSPHENDSSNIFADLGLEGIIDNQTELNDGMDIDADDAIQVNDDIQIGMVNGMTENLDGVNNNKDESNNNNDDIEDSMMNGEQTPVSQSLTQNPIPTKGPSHAVKGRVTRRSVGLKKEFLEPPLKRARIESEAYEDLGYHGGLRFLHIRNDGSIENLKWILKLKKVYVVQLPNMGNEYISRLIFDRTHKSVIGINERDEIVGGITYKPFSELGYIEIAFVAVDASFQIRGSGRKLMNQVKKVCQKQKLFKFLTYADNQAVGFFQKCGFSTDILISPQKFKGYIKTYNGVTLMECNITPGVDYVNLQQTLEKQKQNIMEYMERATKSESSSTIYSGLYYDAHGAGAYRDSKKTERILTYRDIPGMATAKGFKPPQLKQDISVMTANFRQVLEAVRRDENAEIFLEPVSPEMLPDYADFIIQHGSFPIDLKMIEDRLNAGFYRNEKIFIADFCRMFENCRLYNHNNPPFPTYANMCEKTFFTNMVRVKLVEKEYLKKYDKRGKRTKKSKTS